MKIKLTRNVSRAECPWLDRDLEAGETFFGYTGHTYGCIGPNGMAVSEEDGAAPFFEVPRDAVEEQKVFIHAAPKPEACKHDFKGWRTFEDGNGGEQVCTKCGIGAMSYTLSLGDL